MKNIILKTDNISLEAELNDNSVSNGILERVPIASTVSTWGDEIYFTIPQVRASGAYGTIDVESGDVAFWPEGNCLCVFYGRTPASTSEKPVPASEVILVGKIVKGLDEISSIKAGDRVTVDVA
ncbi:cyclophilin-like fold protein [Candidatus Omnitrophota bacterium]